VDRSSYDYVADVYQCPRETCKGSTPTSKCWRYDAYVNNTSISLDSGGADDCSSSNYLCSKGAYGPLCGSCDLQYVYRGETKTCRKCDEAKNSTYLILGIGSGIIMIAIMLGIGYRYRFIKFSNTQLNSVDSGSLKVLWVTYQIIMSVSWNLDIKVDGTV
jgi:transposase-like protein